MVLLGREIRELNEEWRGKRKSTDVLSFPANEFIEPGVIDERFNLEHMKQLGDIIVAPNIYTNRQSGIGNILRTWNV